jgi:hypothetical protein
MRWPRRPRRAGWLMPPGRRSVPAREPWWSRAVPSEPGLVLSPGGGARRRGWCRPGTGCRQRVRACGLTWCPGGCGRGIGYRSSTATRTHGCGGMGPGRSGRPIQTWGTLGARTDGQQRIISANECPVDGRVRRRAAGREAGRLAPLRHRSAASLADPSARLELLEAPHKDEACCAAQMERYDNQRLPASATTA